MDRRAFLTSMSAALGAQMIMPLQRVLAAGADIDPVKLTGAEPLFSARERDAVAVLSEIIIPTTDTPGAIEAGVPGYIEFMLSAWYDDDERARFMAGLTSLLDDVLNADAVLSDSALTPVVQQLHDGAMSGMADGGRPFFEHLKQLTLAGYYTSEIGMTVERVYLPVPGRYDGHYPYEKVGTVFTA